MTSGWNGPVSLAVNQVPARPVGRRRARLGVAIALLVLGGLVAAVGNVALWARDTALDTDTYTDTYTYTSLLTPSPEAALPISAGQFSSARSDAPRWATKTGRPGSRPGKKGRILQSIL